jgi:hypothetical protein
VPNVTVALYGGLGNQMFQYAMGRALALRHGATLLLDHHGFDFDRRYRRKYQLDCFRLPPEVGRVNRPAAFRCARAARRLSEEWRGVAALARPWLLVEPSPEYDGRNLMLPASRSTYVMGYWHDERYFADQADAIRRELRPSGELSPANRELANLIGSVEAVAVHVRRMHGVADPSTRPLPVARNAASLGLEYYRQAMALVASRVASPHFVVFSDDPRWARENVRAAGPATFLDEGRGADHEDLILMSMCRHHVVANSSFSWWGAWLGQTDGQLVVAPRGIALAPSLPERWTSLDPGPT